MKMILKTCSLLLSHLDDNEDVQMSTTTGKMFNDIEMQKRFHGAKHP